MKKFFLLTVSGFFVLCIASVSSAHASEWQKTPCQKSLLSDDAHGALLAQAGAGGGAGGGAGAGGGTGKSSGNVSRSGHGRSKMGEGYDATSHRKKKEKKEDAEWPKGEYPEEEWPEGKGDDSGNEE